jgi:hypothetical protein
MPRDFTAAFWAKVAHGLPHECWPWQGYTKPSGHGLTHLDNQSIHAHRKAWILVKGPIRDGLCVNHRCDNKLCCNPAHLYLGTRADNMADRFGEDSASQRGPGRPFVLHDRLEELRRDREGGMSLKDCAAKYNVHVATICRYVTIRRWAKLRKLRSDRLSLTAR